MICYSVHLAGERKRVKRAPWHELHEDIEGRYGGMEAQRAKRQLSVEADLSVYSQATYLSVHCRYVPTLSAAAVIIASDYQFYSY
jgi:hypothetical protein